MEKIKFAVIGSGWRSEFYIRIAKAVPEKFDLKCVLVRDHEKGIYFSGKFSVPVVNTLQELLQEKPDFVVLSVNKLAAADYLLRLIDAGVPVLSETPPAVTEEDLLHIWDAAEKAKAKVQIAEQYFKQPLYASWLKTISEGYLGEVTDLSISALHSYHAVSIIRLMLGCGFSGCRIVGKKYESPVTKTGGREGFCFSGEVISSVRKRAVFEFENGKTAFFDFTEPVQYHSSIRTRQLTVRGTRGEIDDLDIRYLTDKNIPVKETLRRIDLGIYNNEGWSHYGIMLGDKMLYRSPFENARLNDDEIAIASLLNGMKEYLETGKDIYSLSDGLQDAWLGLKLEEAVETDYRPAVTEKKPWCR